MLEIPLQATEDVGPTLPTSVVVVSHGRPELLRRAVLSLIQQDHPQIELVVVADAAGLAELAALPGRDRIKTELFETANISQARNIGISLAAGEVVAFLDDDAVAEPTWARRLAAPFADPRVDSATGFTRGRNGLSWQWRAAMVDQTGEDHPLDVPQTEVSLHHPPMGGAIKTFGTNAAFRRSALVAIGGFDPRYRYFLDETDVNLRMAVTGAMTAVVPGAQVLHGFASNATRRSDRAPSDLYEIGASSAVFAQMHAPQTAAAVVARFRTEQRHRALRSLVSGLLEPRDVKRLLATFDAGVADGRSRTHGTVRIDPPGPFHAYTSGVDTPRHMVLACRPWQRDAAYARSLQLRAAGVGTTFLCFGATIRKHKVFMNAHGGWEHHGGTLGPAERTEPRIRLMRFNDRVSLEVHRLRPTRAPLLTARRSVTYKT